MCEQCESLKQSLKQLRKDTDRRIAALAVRLRAIEATELEPEDYRPRTREIRRQAI